MYNQVTGVDPAIASISLGAVRKFQIKPISGRPTDRFLVGTRQPTFDAPWLPIYASAPTTEDK